MPVVSYNSTTFDIASAQEAIDTTSSQIFLSRGVAGSESENAAPPHSGSPPSAASVFESRSRHGMILGESARPAAFVRSHQASSLADETRYDVYGSFVQSARRSRYFPSTDGGSASPPDETRREITSRTPIASCHFTKEPEDSASLQCSKTYNVIDKNNEADRGRTLEKGLRYPNPLARAESRPRKDDAAIELDAKAILKRPSRSSTFFEDPTDPCAVLEDDLLEPCPYLSKCTTFSEVLSSPTDSSVAHLFHPHAKTASTVHTSDPAVENPNRTLTTVFNDCRPYSPTPTLPPEALSRVQPNIGHLEALATNSSSQQHGDVLPTNWRNVPKAPPSLAAGLPAEVIQQIFYYLHPADFNSTRRTCRSWFINSLERSILETMLRRGGWSSSIPRSTQLNHALDEQEIVNEEWKISKRISRECALGPDWTGNGLRDNKGTSTIVSDNSAFVHTSTTDFTDIAVHYPAASSSGTVFTVSCCGKFLMAANGCLIYIYELNRTHHNFEDGPSSEPGSLRPVTSIICPRRVLACGMDTSSHRYAVAVLLDGRMGLVCDINPRNTTPSSPSCNRSDYSEFTKTESSGSSNTRNTESNRCRGASFLDRVSLNSSSSNIGSNRASSEPPFVFSGIAATPSQGSTPTIDELCWQDVYHGDSPETTQTEGPSSQHPSLPRTHVLSPGSRLQSMLTPHVERELNVKSMPIETGPRSLYRNLCSDDDPPRSVAICPQRRCVAFGCSAGIELHWVDALTGQDLNRWFPLTAPSDYLFFLPPRKSVDSPKKLRLISSAARPGERAAISERAFRGRSRNSPFWERLGWGAGIIDDDEVPSQTQGIVSRLRNEVRTRGRMDYSDHYRAIPLSDGYHILFTDPSTGLLCLGSDAPVGGPTKLLRKIWFQGPEGLGSPVSYAGGSDLSFGVRVVAAFGNDAEQSVWFFSVPGDVCAANNQSSQTMVKGSWVKSGASSQNTNLEWMNWWPEDGLQEWLNHSQNPVPGVLPRSVWPVKIKGQEIGKLPGLVDLAIDSGPNMTVWAFSSEGVAKVWQLDDGKFDGSVTEKLIARDGTIRELDGEGDVEMCDVPSSSSFSSADVLVPPLPLKEECLEIEMRNTPSLSPNTPVRPKPLQSDSFDGTATFTLSASTDFTTREERHYRIHYGQPIANDDADGEVLMDDLSASGDHGGSQGSLDEMTLAQAGQLVYETFHRSSERLYLHRGPDLVEELTGIARIDIEIR